MIECFYNACFGVVTWLAYSGLNESLKDMFPDTPNIIIAGISFFVVIKVLGARP